MPGPRSGMRLEPSIDAMHAVTTERSFACIDVPLLLGAALACRRAFQTRQTSLQRCNPVSEAGINQSNGTWLRSLATAAEHRQPIMNNVHRCLKALQRICWQMQRMCQTDHRESREEWGEESACQNGRHFL